MLLGGVVLESMVEAALEEHRRMNEALAETALKKASSLQKHPVWAALEADSGKPHDVNPIASKMVVSRLGLSLVSEVLRMLEAQRKRQSRGGLSGGWATRVRRSVSPPRGPSVARPFCGATRPPLAPSSRSASV